VEHIVQKLVGFAADLVVFADDSPFRVADLGVLATVGGFTGFAGVLRGGGETGGGGGGGDGDLGFSFGLASSNSLSKSALEVGSESTAHASATNRAASVKAGVGGSRWRRRERRW
jgi:hypothetical protein